MKLPAILFFTFFIESPSASARMVDGTGIYFNPTASVLVIL